MMNQFSSKQKQKEKLVAQFINFTHSNEKKAVQFLSQHDWKLDLAVDAFYMSLDTGSSSSQSNAVSGAASIASRGAESGRSSIGSLDRRKIDALWEAYKGRFKILKKKKVLVKFNQKILNFIFYQDPKYPDRMTQDGVCKFLQDLNFKLDDKLVLVLAWKFKAKVQGEFLKEDFYSSMVELG